MQVKTAGGREQGQAAGAVKIFTTYHFTFFIRLEHQ